MATKDREVVLSTVEGQPGENGTPRISIVLSYSAGGLNVFTGRSIPRGYSLVARCTYHQDGFLRIVLDGRGNPAALVKESARFSAGTLARLAAEIRGGNMTHLVTGLYEEQVQQRPEDGFPAKLNSAALLGQEAMA